MSTKLVHIAQVAEDLVVDYELRLQDPEKYKPLPTHLDDVDVMLGMGMPNPVDKLIIGIGGAYKRGKTALCLQLAVLRAAQTNERTGFFALEELNEQTALRVFTRHLVNLNRSMFYQMKYSETNLTDMRSLIEELRETRFYVTDQVFSPAEIISIVKEESLDLVVIDNMNLITMPGRTEAEKLDSAMKMFVEARNKLKITFFIVFQLNDQGLALGSRTIYRGSDMVLQLSPAYDYVSGDVIEGKATIELLRGRRSGEGKTEIGFNGDASRFYNLVPEAVDESVFLDFQEPEEEEIVNGSKTNQPSLL